MVTEGGAAQDGAAVMEDLAAEFPGWTFRRGLSGLWYAWPAGHRERRVVRKDADAIRGALRGY